MRHGRPASLWGLLGAEDSALTSRFYGAKASVALSELVEGSILGPRLDTLRGRSILLAATDQLVASLALIDLDGVASRIVLYPCNMPLEHLPYVMAAADIDAVVSDGCTLGAGAPHVPRFVSCGTAILPGRYDRRAQRETEWVLLTSGTTGTPKLVVHTLLSLLGAIDFAGNLKSDLVWSTFYDIRRYGGLQILLRAVVAGSSFVLSASEESPENFLARAGAGKVTHISGTPSHWRRALMSPAAHQIRPQYIRLSGECADQAILDQLSLMYPSASISHAFASTEAGVAFKVADGLAGFPSRFLDGTPGLDLKIEAGSLRIRSDRTAHRYMGGRSDALADDDGFVDTQDMLELRADRYYFVGRRDGIINVGGFKVHPEEVEAVINYHPEVQMSLVKAKKSPVTGAIVVADIVLKTLPSPAKTSAHDLEQDILLFCRAMLPPYKVPAVLHFVSSLQVTESGKLKRANA